MSEHSSSGPSQEITDQEFLSILREADLPVLKTSEIVERDDVPIGARQVENRLKSLEDRDKVGSKKVAARANVRLWWDKNVEAKKSWPSKDEDELMDEIGVEAVDILDLPGRNETLRKRREAVNSVFRYLFAEEEELVASELRLVGWGADMDTYSSPESLWKYCLKPALSESHFFQLNKSKKEWRLSELGSWLKDKDEQGLWNDWDKHKTDIDFLYHQKFQSQINPHKLDDVQSYTSNIAYRLTGDKIDFDHNFATIIDMDGPAWAHDKGTLSFKTVVLDDSDNLRKIFKNREQKTTELGFEVEWQSAMFAPDPWISVTRSQRFHFDISKLLREIGPDSAGNNLARFEEWVAETQNQMIAMLRPEFTNK